MKILFSGGGTLGPVTPLLAIYEEIKSQDESAEFLWVCTKKGPEKQLVNENGLRFLTITSGKLRRYLSLLNFIDVFKIIIGFVQSIKILWVENPDLCISAGGFVSVPLHYAAWILGIPTWVHQQDVKVGLANRLMSPCASLITTALQRNVQSFSKRKTVWLGNPVRKDIFAGNKEEAKKLFNLRDNLPVVLAMGGGTGSFYVNQFVVQSLPHLESVCQIIHITGSERPQELSERASESYPDYHVYKFLTWELKHAFAACDIVISRGGFGSLSEIAALKKAAVIIPKSGHQEENVMFIAESGGAVYLDERTTSGLHLAGVIKDYLRSREKMVLVGENLNKLLPRAVGEEIMKCVYRLTRD